MIVHDNQRFMAERWGPGAPARCRSHAHRDRARRRPGRAPRGPGRGPPRRIELEAHQKAIGGRCMTAIQYRTADVDGAKVFYREAGRQARRSCCCSTASRAPATCSATYPAAGRSLSHRRPGPAGLRQLRHAGARPQLRPDRGDDRPLHRVVGFDRYAVYVFDYGAPTGFRLAVKHPDRITAIISQNGNAYEEGLSDGWNPIRAYWQDASAANRDALRAFLAPETTIWQYTHGVPEPTGLPRRILARQLLPRPARRRRDPARPVRRLQEQRRALPDLPAYFRAHKPPFLAVWGKNDPFSCRRRRGVPARHAGRRRPLLRHRPFRAGDPRGRDRGRHP